MRVYATMDQRLPLAEVEAYARRVERLGYDGLNVPDAVHDGLLMAQAVLRATERLKAATSVLVCFPRSPMTVAVAAWDLQASSGGRFELGLGSQVRGNIERRYGTRWTPPVARMREYVQALRAIWHAFQHGSKLDFQGEQYRFSRLQPFFNPGPIEHPDVPIFLGAVGPRMTELAGEVADGLMTHPTNSAPRFLREVTRPSIATGASRSGRDPAAVALMAGGFVASGADDAEVAAQREHVRGLLGFLYSTPAYWPTLVLHGWEDVGRNLHTLSREGRWAEMTACIDDAMLDALVPRGRYDEIAPILAAWYGGSATHITFPVPPDPARDDEARPLIAALREAA